jgi:hypothetical protein
MNFNRFIVGAALAITMIIYQRGDENRLVHSLEARGYTDIQIEHPNQYYCSEPDSTFSYRARSPSGTPVHGGACVFLYYFITTTETIGKKQSARG